MKKLLIICIIALNTITINAQEDKTYNSLAEALKTPEQVYFLNIKNEELEVLPE